jgi:hypothetical protein
MTLQELIESDSVAKAFADEGNDVECAKRCSEIAEPVLTGVSYTEKMLYKTLGPLMAETIMQKLEGFAEAEQPYSPIVKRAVKWLSPSEGGLEFDATVRGLLDALTAGGLFTTEESNALKTIGQQQPTYSASEVAEAWKNHRPNGKAE